MINAFFRTLVLVGAIQGIVLSLLLFLSATHRQSNRLLGALILLMAMASLNLYLMDTDWVNHSEILLVLFNIIPMVVVMPIGPLIYFYIRSLNDPALVFSRKYRFHFYPVLIDLVPQITALVYVTGLLAGWIRKNDAPWGNFIDNYNVYADIPRWASVSIYLWITYRYVKAHRIAERNIRWPQQFLTLFLVFQVIWLVYLVPYIIPSTRDQLMDATGWYPVYIPLSILIYWLGLKGYIVSHSAVKKSKTGLLKLPDSQLQDFVPRLKQSMETDRLFLDPELNLTSLSKHTGIPSKTLSAILNQCLHKNFNEFVNEYRIAAIKHRLLDTADRNLSIAGLAYECGFNSQPTFQRAFKSVMGQSPSEFIAQNA